VDNAFVSGLHVAFWVAAAVLLGGAVVAAVFVRSGVIASAHEEGDEQTPAAERQSEAAIAALAGGGPGPGPALAPLPAEAYASHPPRPRPDERS
jgi:hypothetical protein